jgi:polyhydroxybutyrate depolymerase
VPILDFHGTADPTVPYEGDVSRGWLSVAATIDDWVARDGCTGPGVETLATGNVRCMTHGKCRDEAEVTLCTVAGGGHTWPGGANVPWIAGEGKTSHSVIADDLIWSFFQRHPMPER